MTDKINADGASPVSGCYGAFSSPPRALDLFCGAGGASMGLHNAGFEVEGVDIEPQTEYPFKFHHADALQFPLEGFDLIWASPPCQAHSTLKHRTGKEYACFIAGIRDRLRRRGGLFIIENVMGAPLEYPTQLCGSSFGLNVRRHRIFETSVLCFKLPCNHVAHPEPIDVSGTGARRLGSRSDGKGGNSRKPRNLQEAREAMGIDWMSRRKLSQAIPPAYSEFLGKQVLSIIQRAREEAA